ncbi:membrane protein [Cohaesibacter sp. ES.047]|uniref:YihY/virulence factor BrkB family protein n=1 Tax=Cohaesibacter sp. ES.047 TaxID=1798205 RepID=UPI000BB7F64F|nr:YihY/virulence factor BrkB family protein [Cohaesibacter sp. ES.047]SNY90824.1 membrane protein [Cohaesibacter sp. ES.047]
MTRLWERLMVPVRIFWRFGDNHGFALASNIAFSMLLSIFPFLLLVTGVTAWAGGDALGNVLQDLLSVLMPDAIAHILQPDVDAVIAERTRSLLSLSLLIFLVTLTSLVESLREGLNRAYGYYERRNILSRRLMGLVAVLGAIVVMVAVAAGLFLAPIAWSIARNHLPWLEDFTITFEVIRLGLTIPILTAFLVASHRWLPMRVIEWRDLWPGVLTTLVLWWVTAEGYSYYLSHFAQYAKVYAGLAGVVATLIFLHIISMIFLYGAEVNAWRIRWRRIQKTRISRLELEQEAASRG